MRISDWSSDVCSSDLTAIAEQTRFVAGIQHALGDWQKSVAQAFNTVGNSLPSALPGTADFGSLMAMFTPGCDAPTGKPAAKAKGHADRKSVVEGKSVSVRVDRGGGRIMKKKKKRDN